MKHEVEFKHWSPDEALRDLVKESIQRLDGLAAGLAQDAVFLRFLIEENPAKTLFIYR